MSSYYETQKAKGEALTRLSVRADERDKIDREIVEQVKICRDRYGASWDAIAEALGISKQAAHKRFVGSTTFGRR